METIRIKVKDTEGAKALIELLKTMNFVESVDIEDADQEREDFYNLALSGLEASYGEDEPDYTDDMIIRPNPLHK